MTELQNTSGLSLPDIGYSFEVTDAGDVRHMLIRASEVAEKRGYHELHRVLQGQAEMVMQGLHVRDMSAVPDMMGDVVAFHQFFGLEYNGKPRMLPDNLFNFRLGFDREETDEYEDENEALRLAVLAADEDEVTKRLDKQLDALVDGIYVKLGTAYLQFGPAAFNEAWRRVQAANMAKVRAEADDSRGHRDQAFDVVKPEGWVAPSHIDLVEDHAHKLYRKEGELNPGHTHDTRSA